MKNKKRFQIPGKVVICALAVILAVLWTGSMSVSAASYQTKKMEATYSNKDYAARTKIGDYYLWQKWTDEEYGSLYYSESRKGSAVRIATGSRAIDDYVTVSGHTIWFLKMEESHNILYKYNCLTQKLTKLMTVSMHLRFTGLYGNAYYFFNEVTKKYFLYDATAKKYTVLFTEKGRNWFDPKILFYGRYQVLCDQLYEPNTKAVPLRIVNMANGRTKVLTEYCYGGPERCGFELMDGKVYYRAFKKAGQTYKTGDSYIYIYDLVKGTKKSMGYFNKEDKARDIRFVNAKKLYCQILGKEYNGYFSYTYATAALERISKTTFHDE